MSWLFVTGHAVDLVLLVLLIEAAWLIWRGEWRSSQVALRLGPGVLMMVALRYALTGAPWWWIALPLALSFPFHIADLTLGPPRR